MAFKVSIFMAAIDAHNEGYVLGTAECVRRGSSLFNRNYNLVARNGTEQPIAKTKARTCVSVTETYEVVILERDVVVA